MIFHYVRRLTFASDLKVANKVMILIVDQLFREYESG